jgi:hypothetical protein
VPSRSQERRDLVETLLRATIADPHRIHQPLAGADALYDVESLKDMGYLQADEVHLRSDFLPLSASRLFAMPSG